MKSGKLVGRRPHGHSSGHDFIHHLGLAIKMDLQRGPLRFGLVVGESLAGQQANLMGDLQGVETHEQPAQGNGHRHHKSKPAVHVELLAPGRSRVHARPSRGSYPGFHEELMRKTPEVTNEPAGPGHAAGRFDDLVGTTVGRQVRRGVGGGGETPKTSSCSIRCWRRGPLQRKATAVPKHRPYCFRRRNYLNLSRVTG